MRCGGKTPKMPLGFVAIIEDHSGSTCRRRPTLISSPTSHVGRSTTPTPLTAASRSGSESSARNVPVTGTCSKASPASAW